MRSYSSCEDVESLGQKFLDKNFWMYPQKSADLQPFYSELLHCCHGSVKLPSGKVCVAHRALYHLNVKAHEKSIPNNTVRQA